MKHRIGMAAALFFFLFTALAHADEAEWSSLPINEHLMGATNIHAIIGNGALSAGIGRNGEITALIYPSPSYTDQLAYLSSNHPEARNMPFFGAKESMGIFFGLRYREDGEEKFQWMHGGEWYGAPSYRPDAPVTHTSLFNDALGVTVEIQDFVHYDLGEDILTRRVQLMLDEDCEIEPISIVAYANLSPTLARIAKLPIADWALDTKNDFAAIYSEEEDAILHFRPGDTGRIEEILDLIAPPPTDYGIIGEMLKSDTIDEAALAEIADNLDSHYAEGVYIAMGSNRKVAGRGVQIGFDTTDLCGSLDEIGDNILLIPERFPEADPMDLSALDMLRCNEPALDAIREKEGWVYEAADAYQDAPDGLSGSHIAAGQVNTAMEMMLFEAFNDTSFETSLHFAFGKTAEGALNNLAIAREKSASEHMSDTEHKWNYEISKVRLPKTEDEEILAFHKRTLINLLLGMDRNTGAIVASFSRQPAYGEDWPRDGAFFNAALDAAGLHEWVTTRMHMYAEWQRKEPEAPEALIDPTPPVDPSTGLEETFPAGAWEMNYYADGTNGGFIRFEIDNTAFLLWNYAYHAGYIADEAERMDYLEAVWPSVKLGADLLVRWKDEETGLHAPANENDNPAYTQTLFGAGPVFAGLVGSAKIAKALGHEEDATRYDERALEMREAILTHLVDEETGLLKERRNLSGHPGSNLHAASSTAIWPGRLLDFNDERVQRQMNINLEDVIGVFEGELEGGSYLNKVTLAAAVALNGHEGYERLDDALYYLTEKMPTAQTKHYGEVFLHRDGAFRQQVATPHLWAATLTYLTAMAVDYPELFDKHMCVLPAVEADTPHEIECVEEEPPVDGDEDYDLFEDRDLCDAPEPPCGWEENGDEDRKKNGDGCRQTSSPFAWLLSAFLLLFALRKFRRLSV